MCAEQELRTACKRAQAGRGQAEARCADLEEELETQRAATNALRQVSHQCQMPLSLTFQDCH